MKFLNVTFYNGEKYRIPAEEIADKIATMSHQRGTHDWDTLYTAILNDDEKVINAARRQMTWADLEHFASRVEQPAEIDYDAEWPNNVKVMCSDA